MSFKLASRAIKEDKVKCVILAGGEGWRQGPATDRTINRSAVAKPLLPVAGRKIIDFSIASAQHLGLHRVEIAAGRHWGLFNKMLLSPERCVSQSRKGNFDIKIKGEKQQMGTLGGALETFKVLDKDDTVIILSGDIVSNFDLKPVLEKHLETGAAATVVSLPIPWESEEWKERTFPVILTKGTPQMAGERWEFEDRLKAYHDGLRGNARKITEFAEMSERNKCPSNLSITSIYLFSAKFLNDLKRVVTPKGSEGDFSDFGFHVFPLLAGQFDKFPGEDMKDIIRKIERGQYPFYAYTPPETGIGGQPLYWHDVFDPMALWKINMEAMRGLANSWITKEDRFNQTPWGFVGDSSYISPDARIGDISERYHHQKGISIIGSNVSISRGVKIGRSFIDDYTNLQPYTEVFNSVVSLGLSRPTSYIGKTRLVNCLVLGEGFPPDFADIRMLRNALVFNVPYFDGVGIVPLQAKHDDP